MRFIPTAGLQPGMKIGRDLIARKTAPLLKRGTALSDDIIEYLDLHGYMGVYISDAISEEIAPEETVSKETFIEGLDAVAGQNVSKMFGASAKIVYEIMQRDNVSVDLLDLRSFDDYTYHHSVNVAVYSVVVGKKLGLSEKDIDALSQAAICHDLGKKFIPEEILNKPGKLTDEEYEIIKKHPEKSVEMLNDSGNVSAVVKQAILFHHENENGSGYPKHKMGSELSIIVKIIHAVDVYDALTSKRPYKDPYAPIEAFEYLKGGADILFDRKVVEAMMEVIPAFPPGIEVTLSTEETGIVMGHSIDPLRPMVKMMDGRIIDLALEENSSILIIKSGIMLSDYSSEVEMLNEDRNKPINERKKIMVVDDMMMSLVQTKSILGMDYDVSLSRNGLEALGEIFKKGYPDLFIVDIEMPTMDGFTFVKNLRNKGVLDIPIIFLTAKADKDTVVRCIELGASDYIVKPALPIYLKERVALALGYSIDR